LGREENEGVSLRTRKRKKKAALAKKIVGEGKNLHPLLGVRNVLGKKNCSKTTRGSRKGRGSARKRER